MTLTAVLGVQATVDATAGCQMFIIPATMSLPDQALAKPSPIMLTAAH